MRTANDKNKNQQSTALVDTGVPLYAIDLTKSKKIEINGVPHLEIEIGHVKEIKEEYEKDKEIQNQAKELHEDIKKLKRKEIALHANMMVLKDRFWDMINHQIDPKQRQLIENRTGGHWHNNLEPLEDGRLLMRTCLDKMENCLDKNNNPDNPDNPDNPFANAEIGVIGKNLATGEIIKGGLENIPDELKQILIEKLKKASRKNEDDPFNP